MAIKILILGKNGLLGNMVYSWFSNSEKFIVMDIDENLRWPSANFKDSVINSDAEFIINCIGAIHQKTKNFSINHELPIWLDSIGKKIVHPGTDCEMDEDEYGISKRVSRNYIMESGKNTKIIKTSIIGPELLTKFSLMSWFLSNNDGDVVNGFTNQFWNGNTTLTWSIFCENLIKNWNTMDKENILYSMCISKFELLKTINSVFERNITVNPYESKNHVNKCLIGQFQMDNIKVQLSELKKYIENEDK